MTPKSATAATEDWYAHSEKTSQTDDERIRDVTPLPQPRRARTASLRTSSTARD